MAGAISDRLLLLSWSVLGMLTKGPQLLRPAPTLAETAPGLLETALLVLHLPDGFSDGCPFCLAALTGACTGCNADAALLDPQADLLGTAASAVARLLVLLRSSEVFCRNRGLGQATLVVARMAEGKVGWVGGLGRGTRLKSGGASDLASRDLSSDLS